MTVSQDETLKVATGSGNWIVIDKHFIGVVKDQTGLRINGKWEEETMSIDHSVQQVWQ